MRFRRLRLVCGVTAVLCLLVTGVRLVASVAPLADPALSSTIVRCSLAGCRADVDPIRLIPESKRDSVDSQGRAALDDLLSQPSTKLALSAGELARSLPVALVFLFLSLAFRRLAQGFGFDALVVRGVRRASVAAFASVIGAPIADTVRASVFSPVTTGHADLYIAFNGPNLVSGLLLAGAVLTVAWALEEASETHVALAEFV